MNAQRLLRSQQRRRTLQYVDHEARGLQYRHARGEIGSPKDRIEKLERSPVGRPCFRAGNLFNRANSASR
jgi:hypothetical protein